MKYLLYLFDLDGTLINSERSILSALKDTAVYFGLRGVKWDRIRSLIGTSLNQILEEMGIHAHFIPEAGEFYRKRYYHYLDFFEEPFAGISEMLAALHNKILLSVCTNKGEHGAETTLRKTGLYSYLDHVVCAGELKYKPDGEMLEEVLRLYAGEGKFLNAGDILMIGDSTSDADFAYFNGMDFAFAEWGFFRKEDLPRNPELILNDPMQLVTLLENDIVVKLDIGSEIDLHNYAPTDILQVLRVYLKESRKNKFKVVRVIHGKGKGLQRAQVRKFLSTHPLVKNFYDAPAFMGGMGATIVEFK